MNVKIKNRRERRLKTIDEINEEFKNLAIYRNQLIDKFLEDLNKVNDEVVSKWDIEQLIKKWEAKKDAL